MWVLPGYPVVVLLSPRYLVDRIRHPRSRADQLVRLRARFAAQPGHRNAPPELVALASELRTLRIELSEALREVESCRSCATGHPLPHGRWDGGHCCGGKTLEIFSSMEVAALKLAGGTVGEPPTGDHAGCVFRGSTGCSLEPADRPTLCVRFVCSTLRTELKGRSDWARIAALGKRITDLFERFAQIRSDRHDDLAFRRSLADDEPATSAAASRRVPRRHSVERNASSMPARAASRRGGEGGI